HRGAAQGDKDPVWVKHDKGPVSALKGAEQRQAELQEEITKLEQQSKELADQRKSLLADAERLERESDSAQGKQSVELFNQSSEARKKAADLGVQVDGIEAKLVPLRQDQQVAQANSEL